MKIILFVCIAMLSVIFKSSAQTTPAKSLPEFEFYRLDQSAFTNKDLPPGKILFFIFFDSDCDHCQRAIHQIGEDYKSYQQTAIFLITLDNKDKINHFMAGNAPRLMAQKNVIILRDTRNQFIARFKPLRYPAMFLYSPGKKLIDYEDNELTVFRLVNTIKKSG